MNSSLIKTMREYNDIYENLNIVYNPLHESTSRVDTWGHPVLTKGQVVSIAENMIPEKLRPYYVGVDVMKQRLDWPWSEWNSDIILYFKYPVCSDAVTDSRYAHGSLFEIKEELENMYIDEDSRTDELSEYDEENDNMPTKPIMPLKSPVNWHLNGYEGEIYD